MKTDLNKRVMNRSLDKLAPEKKAPTSTYIILLVSYIIADIVVSVTANAKGSISLAGMSISIYAFAVVFSSVANICVILMTIFCGKKGYITSMIVLLVQLPIILMGVIGQHNLNSLPGVFGNILAVIAITAVFLYNQKVNRAHNEIRRQAVTDTLTGLPNMYATFRLIGDLLKSEIPFVNVTININGFKSLNETMGYNAGNTLLIEAAKRLRALCESGDTGTVDFITHLSSDEFALIIRDFKSEDEALNTIKMYDAALNEKFTIDDCDLYMTASFGYVCCPSEADSVDNACAYATAAMREVKRHNSSNHILHFTPDLLKESHTLEIEGKIRAALENDTIFFNLQPQFSISHELRGFEALARMKDADGSFISPGEFIPVAEKVGLVDKVDGAVFRKAAIFLGDLMKRTELDIMLSVNVSVRHLMKNDFIEEVRDVLRDSGIPPKNLEIEITESIMIESVDRALLCIHELENMGVKIAIDDFGTGYSSLSYLHRFPANLLKIDKSFIDDMNSSKSSKEYVAAIISIGHIMGFDVISEGVEEDDQLDTLREIGCDFIQGYIWGKPLMPDAAEELVMKCSEQKNA